MPIKKCGPRPSAVAISAAVLEECGPLDPLDGLELEVLWEPVEAPPLPPEGPSPPPHAADSATRETDPATQPRRRVALTVDAVRRAILAPRGARSWRCFIEPPLVPVGGQTFAVP